MSATVVLSLAPQVEDRLLPQLVEEGHRVLARSASAIDAAAVLRPGVDVVLASAGRRHLDAALVRGAAQSGATLVVLAADDEDREAARAVGAAIVLAESAPLAELLAASPQVPGPVPLARPTVARGRMVTVWGPAGAPGRTTTALAVAAEIAAAGRSVVLVDADTVGASIAPALGLVDEAPGIAAACRLAAAGALDARELDRLAHRVPGPRGELSVLTGIGRPSRWPELSADRVGEVLAACRDRFDAVVVDAGFSLEADEEIVSDLFAPRRNAATLVALRDADRVVAVGAADPVGLARFVRGWADLVELVPPERISAVVSKVRASAVGLNPGGQVRASLARFGGIEEVVLVPHDPVACDTALLTARPLPDAAPRSAATAAIRGLVTRELLPMLAPAAARRPAAWPIRRFRRPVPA